MASQANKPRKEDKEMKKLSLSILSFLATLVFFTSLAYSAAPQIPTTASPEPGMTPAAIVAVKSASSEGIIDASFVNSMINLMASDVEYSLNESTAVILACSPFADQQSDDYLSQPTSNISVGLKFSF